MFNLSVKQNINMDIIQQLSNAITTKPHTKAKQKLNFRKFHKVILVN